MVELLTHPLFSFPAGPLSVVATFLCWTGFALAIASSFSCEFFARIVRAQLFIVPTQTQFPFSKDASLGMWYFKGDWEDANLAVDAEDNDCHPYEDAFNDDDHWKTAQALNIVSMGFASMASFSMLFLGCRLLTSGQRKLCAGTIYAAMIAQGMQFLVFQGEVCANKTIQELNPNILVLDFEAHCRVEIGGNCCIGAMVLWLFTGLCVLAIKDTPAQMKDTSSLPDGVEVTEETVGESI